MFLDQDFLLENEWAIKLFHGYAKGLPIIDYHCHLEPKDLVENRPYENLTQLWLGNQGIGDHYKWRLMRANGVKEEFISGDGDPYEKFLAFVKTIEKAPGNPIFEWSHLELRRYFDISLLMTQANAPKIWDLANERIRTEQYRPKELVKMMKVEVICTTDDPADELNYHQVLAKQGNPFKVLPTFRPDNIWEINSEGYPRYIERLEKVVNFPITSIRALKEALSERIDFFHAIGGRLADQGLNAFFYEEASLAEIDCIFSKARSGYSDFSRKEVNQFITFIQLFLMKEYNRKNWTMQMHMNVLRNTSTQLKKAIGINVGGDSMGDQSSLTYNVIRLFDQAQQRECLPKTILYSLNPSDWFPLATAMQSFQGGVRQKIQLGCAWWFNDTAEGIRQQLTIMASQSLLANFTGMLTDSRSFLSYPRHEYFRRVCCQLIGEWVVAGRLPEDEQYLGSLVEAISYTNARDYFQF